MISLCHDDNDNEDESGDDNHDDDDNADNDIGCLKKSCLLTFSALSRLPGAGIFL